MGTFWFRAAKVGIFVLILADDERQRLKRAKNSLQNAIVFRRNHDDMIKNLTAQPQENRVLETTRLILRRLMPDDDAPFMLALLNSPGWLQYIGDRGVHTLEDARNYILNGALASYEKHGFGPYVVRLKDETTPLGVCGLFKRENLEDVDLGFAFLPGYMGQGYGFEAASAVINYAESVWGLKRLVAITVPYNTASIHLLKKLGFQFEKMIRLADDAEELMLLTTKFT